MKNREGCQKPWIIDNTWIIEQWKAAKNIPVEVKAEENLQSKSLETTIAKYPGMKGLRFSMSDYREQDDITNVPLYGARGYLEAYNWNNFR